MRFSSSRRVFRFDDARHRAVRIAHDAAVGRRDRELHREQRERVAGALVLIEQPAQRFGRAQRHVAGEDQHALAARRFGEARARLQHGVTGAELLLLHGEPRPRLADRLLHGFALMADHHRTGARLRSAARSRT